MYISPLAEIHLEHEMLLFSVRGTFQRYLIEYQNFGYFYKFDFLVYYF